MPSLGEIKRGKELGKTYRHRFIWQACPDCGKTRWVRYAKGKAVSDRCVVCATRLNNKKHLHGWKGGRIKDNYGYIAIRVYPDDFFYPMANLKGYILEHRLVVAKALHRCLLPWEIIHHKGAKYPSESVENRSDNRYPENLELIGCSGKHNTQIQQELKRQAKEIKVLQERITLLEAENVLLRAEQLSSLLGEAVEEQIEASQRLPWVKGEGKVRGRPKKQ